jgi:hypothetical protein
VAIELSDELLELERKAWSEQQAGELTVETAWAVQSAVTAHAEATGQDRFKVEAETEAAGQAPGAARRVGCRAPLHRILNACRRSVNPAWGDEPRGCVR